MKSCKHCVHKVLRKQPIFRVLNTPNYLLDKQGNYIYCGKGNKVKYGIIKCRQWKKEATNI